MKTRRNFIKNSVGLAAGMGVLPSLTWQDEPPYDSRYVPEISDASNLPLLMEENATRLAWFDPAIGAVPNPGMGISGFVHSDHMTANYPGPDAELRMKKGLLTLDRQTFDKMATMPYNDNLYLRYEWRDIQKEKGKLSLPDSWKWTVEAAEKLGKRWSFRIMNFMPQSTANNGLPEFLQGRFKMIPYFHKTTVYGKQPYYFPEYSNDMLAYWDEMNYLLGEAFDKDPNLEYVDVSGYGLWGEFHHWLNLTTEGGPQQPHHPESSERTEVIIDRIIRNHLKAFPNTPAALNIHAAEFNAGMKAFSEGLCWARRDSFQDAFRTVEARIAQGLKPGNAMVWEQMMPGRSFPTDAEIAKGNAYLLPQRYFDVQAHYVGIGFNPWVNIWAHENCSKSLEFIQQNIGYRIRPSFVVRRRIDNKNEIVLCLRNDGCSPPPGTITITAKFPDGTLGSVELPAGEPAPGALKMYAIPLQKDPGSYGQNAIISFSMSIKMRGKSRPVQWAVKKEMPDRIFDLQVPLR
jgi:hypothetical protein